MQKYTKEVENEITGNEDMSLSPLFKSIEELRKAATKVNRQREVVLKLSKIMIFAQIALLMYWKCDNSQGRTTTKQGLAINMEER